MLDQFFSKIQTVQKDLVSNFNLSANRKQSPDDDPLKQHDTVSSNCNQRTPSIVLCNYYQTKWNELHQLMERNVNLIVDSQKCLKEEVNSISQKQLQSQQSFNLTLKSLSEIESGLEELDQDLTNVQRSVELVEKLLKSYEKKKFEEALKRQELDGQLDYQNGCKIRSNEFEVYKLKLLNDHKKKANEIEKLRYVKYKKKSSVFQNNFEKELEEFKRTGKLPSRASSSNDLNKQPVSVSLEEKMKKLEEINVETDDQDLKALNDFLNDLSD